MSKIVIVFQENHTFDNYFGTFPGTDNALGKGICLPDSPGSSKCTGPFHSITLTPPDMPHGWDPAHADYDDGRMDAFVYTEGGPETMSYFDGTDIPHYWNAARSYVLCDRYFTSVMTQSAPNHLYLVAGTAGGATSNQLPSTLTFPPIFPQLDTRGVSWKVYGFTSWYEKFQYVQKNQSSKHNFAAAAVFQEDLAKGGLPDVSWIIGAPGGDEHPPKNVQTGSTSVADIVNALGSSEYWSSLAIFVTWDDYGGWYDHVSPPQVDSFGYGFRVPCLAISPFAKKGFVDSTPNDHTSLLKYVETRFGLQPMSTRDAAAGNMAECFDYATVRPFEQI